MSNSVIKAVGLPNRSIWLAVVAVASALQAAAAVTPPAIMFSAVDSNNVTSTLTIDGSGTVTLGGACTSATCTGAPAKSTGSIGFTGTVGPFFIVNALFETKPITSPGIDLGLGTVFNISSGAATLTVTYTDTGFNVAAGPVSLKILPDTGGAVTTYSAWYDTNNQPFSTTSTSTSAVAIFSSQRGTADTNTTIAVPASEPVSLTGQQSFTLGAGTSYSTDYELLATLYPISLTCSSTALSTGTDNIPFSNSPIVLGGNTPYTFFVSSGTLPNNITLNAQTGLVSGSATTTGSFMIAARDASNPPVVSNSCPYTFHIPPPSLSCVSVGTTGQIGVPFTSNPPLVFPSTMGETVSFQLAPGSTLPSALGLMLNSMTGVLTGTPTAVGTVSIQSVEDGIVSPGSCPYKIINNPPVISCTAKNSTTVGTAFPTSSPVTVSGGTAPYTYSVLGTLPTGLSLSPASPTSSTTLTISGTPTTTGSFYIQVKDANNLVAIGNCPYVVGSTPVSCTNLPYPTGTAPALSSVIFNESTVLQAFASGISKTDGSLQVQAFFSDEHAPLLGARAVSVITSKGTTTTDYSSMFTAYTPGTTGVYTPNTPLPVGTTARTGTQAGTDTALQSSSYNYGAGYAFNGRPLWPSLFITDLTANGLTSTIGDWQNGGTAAAPPNGIYGAWKGATVTVDQTQTPPVMSVTTDADPAQNGTNNGPPPGIPDTPPGGFGQNLGYFTEAVWNVKNIAMVPGHTYRVQTIVHDGDQNKSGGDVGEACISGLTVPIAPLSLTFSGTTGNVGTAYNSSLVAVGGVGPFTYTVTSATFPTTGLSFNAGAITGVPTTATPMGSPISFTAKVTDNTGNMAVGTFTITIGAQLPLNLLCPTVTTFSVGNQVNSPALAVSGGYGPYTFSIGSGTLPAGLMLNTATGAITGMPTASGIFTIEVTDFKGDIATSCPFNVTPCLLSKLGTAGSFAVLGLAGAQVNVQANIPGGGTVAIGAGGTLHVQGNTALTNPVYADTTATITVDKGASQTGNTTTESFAGIQSSATMASTLFAALTPTQIISKDINAGMTISSTFGSAGGQNVILLNNAQINLNTGNNLTISGGPNDTFIFNITQGKNFTLANGASIILTGGVPASQVIFNFTGNSNVQVQSNNTGTSNTSGIFLDPTGQINVQGGVQNSVFISGNQIQIQPGPAPPPPPGTPPTPASGPTINPLTCALMLACPASAATMGTPYSSALTATGGLAPYTFTISSGSLPSGLTLTPGTSGAITGTPATSTASTFTAKVTDSAHPTAATATVSCTIN